ncbi:hypothetical protein V6N11_025905 [Hibiscus sabdariffa]|uniref:Uncharacterized protein n=1 Tax=Hibiscus sabdariffa TaxID=183260 RepID=A0ABR2SU20_9ROSI
MNYQLCFTEEEKETVVPTFEMKIEDIASCLMDSTWHGDKIYGHLTWEGGGSGHSDPWGQHGRVHMSTKALGGQGGSNRNFAL